MRWFPVVLTALCAVPQGAFAQIGTAPNLQIPSYPPEVSLVSEGERGFVYRQSSNNLRLYTYDRDTATTSACVGKCASAWPPLLATAKATPIGEWTIVNRVDGTRQWAYRGRPAYTRFHDAPGKPAGDGIDGAWHLLPYTQKP